MDGEAEGRGAFAANEAALGATSSREAAKEVNVLPGSGPGL